jgi:hypothetical protein
VSDDLLLTEAAAPGAVLLDDLHAALTRYVILPTPEAADAVTLWIAATHALPAFQHAPRLAIASPEKRCGKSRLLDIIAGTCHRPLMSVNATVAAIFRAIGADHPPTVLVDEADTLWGTRRAAEQNEDLRALINAGHQRGRPALRCVGPQQTPTEFATFSMAALAGIGSLPDTITDRAVNVILRRRKAGERVAQFRTRRDGPVLEDLQDRLAAWAAGAIPKLADVEPEMPVEDRAADTWEPLVAIADHVGGNWPHRARTACRVLTAAAEEADEDMSLNLRLLTDVRTVFTKRAVSFLATADLVAALKGMDESPWDDFDLNARRLAQRLKDYGVKPQHNSTGTTRGYRLDDLHDAFSRYLRQDPSDPSDAPSGLRRRPDGSDASDTSTRQTANKRQKETAAQGAPLTGLTDPDAPAAETCGHDGRRAPNGRCITCITEGASA